MDATNIEKATLNNNCIKAFILRVDMIPDTIQSMAPIIEMVSKHFDRVEKRDIIIQSIKNATDGAPEVINNKFSEYVLVSDEKGIALTFSDGQKGYWIESKKYKDNSIYQDTVELIHTAFAEKSLNTFSKRIGMRYINTFACAKPNNISSVFNKRVSTIIKNMISEPNLSRAICQEEYNCTDYKTRLQYGIPNKFFPAIINNYDLLLDIDTFDEGKNKCSDWPESIRTLNHAAYKFFLSMMNPKYLQGLK